MKRKNTFSKVCYEALENTRNQHFQITNRSLGLITLIAVLAVVLETVQFFQPYQFWLNIIEYTATAIFTFEYVIRFIETRPRTSYIFSFFGIIDLLAIAPSVLGLGNFTFLKAGRSLRTIRLLRIARLAKLARFKNKDKGGLSVAGINLEIYFLALFILVIFLGSSFYLFESSQPKAANIPMGILWVIKIITGGLPTPQPDTFGGIMTLVLTRFSAAIIFGFIIGLIGTILRVKLIGSKSDL